MKFKHQVSCLLLAMSVSFATRGFAEENKTLQTTKKPIIGINLDVSGERPRQVSISMPYIEAVKKAGGIPVLLPPLSGSDVKSVLAHVDGLILIGGMDYPPAMYGENSHTTVETMDEERAKFDHDLVQKAIAESSIPVLGICAGSQIMNIALGGSLVQDIPSVKPTSKHLHASVNGWKNGFNKHKVTFDSSSKLARIYSVPDLSVPTSHHQCVNRLGKQLQCAARAEDGMIEAIELPGPRFVVGVQWHPERDFENNKALFQELVKQASQSL